MRLFINGIDRGGWSAVLTTCDGECERRDKKKPRGSSSILDVCWLALGTALAL